MSIDEHDNSAASQPSTEVSTATPIQSPLSRRSFMGVASQIAVTAAAVGATTTVQERTAYAHRRRPDERISPLDQELVEQNLRVRKALAAENASVPVPRHPNNGDEARYPNKQGS